MSHPSASLGHVALRRVSQLGVGVLIAVHLWGLTAAWLPVPYTATMLQRGLDGAELKRDWVPLERMAPDLVLAVIASEDNHFCSHPGIDTEAIGKALEDRKRGKLRGGSTITQQTAKNVFLWQDGGWLRKGVEAWFALGIDAIWGKRRVIEVYLNVAEWGDGVFGAEAAAQAHFGKPAAELTRREAARLAAILPSPRKWSVDGPYVNKRSKILEDRMAVMAAPEFSGCVGTPQAMVPR